MPCRSRRSVAYAVRRELCGGALNEIVWKKWNILILTDKFEHSLNIAYLFCNFCQFIFRSRFLHFFFPAARV